MFCTIFSIEGELLFASGNIIWVFKSYMASKLRYYRYLSHNRDKLFWYFLIGSYTNYFWVCKFLTNSDTRSSYSHKFGGRGFNGHVGLKQVLFYLDLRPHDQLRFVSTSSLSTSPPSPSTFFVGNYFVKTRRVYPNRTFWELFSFRIFWVFLHCLLLLLFLRQCPMIFCWNWKYSSSMV